MENEFKTLITFPGGNENDLCFYPTRLDTYGKGCVHNCAYCYARTVLEFRKLWDSETAAGIDAAKIKEMFRLAYETNKTGKHDILRTGVPLRIGSMSDAMQPDEPARKITLEVLKILHEYKHPYLLISKSELIAADEYMKFYHSGTYIQTTVTTLNETIRQQIEMGAGTTLGRVQAIGKVRDEGFCTAIRINPLFPIYPDGWYSQNMGAIAKHVQPLPIFTWALIDECTRHTDMIIAGFVRLSWDSLKRISKITGLNLGKYFLTKTKNKNSALHYSTEEKRHYYEMAQLMAKNYDCMFSVCYDGDSDYEKFRYLWHNPDDCCNGLGRVFTKTGHIKTTQK